MDFKDALSEAREFKLAGQVCYQEFLYKRYFPNAKTAPAIPIMHNFSFAIELYLKCLLIKEGKPTTGHDLKKLFDRLKDGTKKHIAVTSNINHVPVLEHLFELHSKLYDVRYIYQKKFGSGMANFNFLREISQALDRTIYDLYITDAI